MVGDRATEGDLFSWVTVFAAGGRARYLLPIVRPMHHNGTGRSGRWAAVGVALLLVLGAPAGAQERYDLRGGEWQPQPTHPPDSAEGELQAIRKLLAQGDGREAEKRAASWIKRRPNHPDLVEAHLLRGDARSARGRYYEALYDYEFVIRYYPATEQYQTALEREYEIARIFTAGLNRHFLGFRLLPADGEGEELFIRIQERAPGSPLGEKASLGLADYYFDQGQVDLAAEAYDLFLENYPRSAQREWAMLRLIQASLARFRGPEHDPTGLFEAGQRLRMYREEFPASADRIGADALLVRINESLAAKDYTSARWYERRNRDVSAAFLYRRVVEDYPQTAAAQSALARLEALEVPGYRVAIPPAAE